MKNKKAMTTILSTFLLCGLMLNGCGDKQTAPQSPQEQSSTTQTTADVQTTSSADGILQSFTANTLDGGTYTQDNFQFLGDLLWSVPCGNAGYCSV